jgi:predicted small secreted protein
VEDKMKLFKVLLFALVIGAGIAGFTGCRTAHGFGEDMENAGESIQRGTDR